MMHRIHVPLTYNEFMLLKLFSYCRTIRELSRRSNLPFSTVYKTLERLKTKAFFRFIPDFRMMNLIFVFALFDEKTEALRENPFTICQGRLIGKRSFVFMIFLLPFTFLDIFLKSLEEKPFILVKGLEINTWKYEQNLFYFDYTRNFLNINLEDILELYPKYSQKLSKWKPSYDAPDVIDIGIVLSKYRKPFGKVYTLIKMLRAYDPSFPLISRQVLSYHYTKHVLEKYWLFNTIFFKTEQFQALYFEGDETHIIGRILVKIPYLHYSLIDSGRSVVVGSFPAQEIEKIRYVISKFNVSMPLGVLSSSFNEICFRTPRLWRYIRDKKWCW